MCTRKSVKQTLVSHYKARQLKWKQRYAQDRKH